VPEIKQALDGMVGKMLKFLFMKQLFSVNKLKIVRLFILN
jgi:hypothetical protein